MMLFKDYTSHHTTKLVELLNTCFRTRHITNESFLWKHFDPFFAGKSIGMLALDNLNICSFVCFTPVEVLNRDRVATNFYSCAVQATHPNYRKQGLVSNLTHLIEQKLGPGISYLGFSNEDGVKIDRFSKKINYSILGQMQTNYVLSLPYKTKLTIKRSDEPHFSADYTSKLATINKTPSYLMWRYGNQQYDYYEIFKESESIGFIICRQTAGALFPRNLKMEVAEIILKDFNEINCSEAIKSFAAYSLLHGKLFVSYAFLPNAFWTTCFQVPSLKRRISIYFTIKTSDSSLLSVNDWIIQAGDVQ